MFVFFVFCLFHSIVVSLDLPSQLVVLWYLWLCLFRLLVLAFQFLRISLVSFFSSPFSK